MMLFRCAKELYLIYFDTKQGAALAEAIISLQLYLGFAIPIRYPTNAETIRRGRMGRYKRQSLIERYGADAAMPDVLNEITACEQNQRLSVERCRAYYVELREQAQTLRWQD